MQVSAAGSAAPGDNNFKRHVASTTCPGDHQKSCGCGCVAVRFERCLSSSQLSLKQRRYRHTGKNIRQSRVGLVRFLQPYVPWLVRSRITTVESHDPRPRNTIEQGKLSTSSSRGTYFTCIFEEYWPAVCEY